MMSRWKQRPHQEAAPDERRLTELRAAMAEGWTIELPIIARPGWSNRRGTPRVLHFIMVLHERRRLFVLDDTPALRKFLAEQRLAGAVGS